MPTHDTQAAETKQWDGYTLDQLRFRRALALVKLESQKALLAQNVTPTTGKSLSVKSALSLAAGMVSERARNLSVTDIALMATGVARFLLRRKKTKPLTHIGKTDMGTSYTEVDFTCKPFNEDEMDILAAFLCDCGYDSFETTKQGMKAYIPTGRYQQADVEQVFTYYKFASKITWQASPVPDRDWNEQWEKDSFQPIVIAGECVVHATHHQQYPQCPYDITINPRMSFGSGHHETTSMMIEAMLHARLQGKKVIDMGAGTGILSIMAALLGAATVTGIEIDAGAYENAKENIALNHVDVNMLHSDASALAQLRDYDVLLANINRNIILADIDRYVASLKPGATVIVSGFYAADVAMLTDALAKRHLLPTGSNAKNDWTLLQLQYNPPAGA